MSNSISGNCGRAGAIVQCIGAWSGPAGTIGVVTADGSGNYTIPGLGNGTYNIRAWAQGYQFSPGSSFQTISGADITGLNFTASVVVGEWKPLGVVIPPNITDLNGGSITSGTQEPNVLYEGSPLLISANPDGKVFKCWFAGQSNVYYAEANAARGPWTRQSSPLVTGKGNPRLFKNGGTYYLFVAPPTGGQIDVYSATDGVTFTLLAAAIIAPGSAGQWDETAVWDMNVAYVDGGGVWHAVYTGTGTNGAQYNTGYVTASDPAGPWTKSASNPVLLNVFNLCFQKIASTIYAWGQTSIFLGNGSQPFGIPTEMAFTSTTDFISWAAPSVMLQRTLWQENVGSSEGQTGTDPTIVEANGKTYAFFTTTRTGTTGTGFQLAAAEADMTVAQLVQTSQGAVPVAADIRQVSSGGSASASNAVTSDAINVQNGDLIVVAVRTGAAGVTVSGVDDSGGVNVYTKINSVNIPLQLGDNELWYCENVTGSAALQVTAHFSASQGYNAIFVWDAYGAISLDQNETASDPLSSDQIITSPSFTTTAANELMFAWMTSQNISDEFATSIDCFDSVFPTGAGLLFCGAAHALFSSIQTGITLSMSQSGTAHPMTLNLATFKVQAPPAPGPPPTHTISGNAGIAGATVSYTGPSSGSVVADGSGSYSIPNLADGAYILAPTLAGYVFSPTRVTVVVADANFPNVNFVATKAPTGDFLLSSTMGFMVGLTAGSK